MPEQKHSTDLKERFAGIIKKPNKNTWLLCIAAGALLLVIGLPSGEKVGKPDASGKEEKTGFFNEEMSQEDYTAWMESRVQKFLAGVEGVGKTDVMIVLEGSKESVVLSDTEESKSSTEEEDEGATHRSISAVQKKNSTVFTEQTGENRPFVKQEIYPKIGGVIISAEGGDSPVIIAKISQAMEALFGLSPNKIRVLKRVNE